MVFVSCVCCTGQTHTDYKNICTLTLCWCAQRVQNGWPLTIKLRRRSQLLLRTAERSLLRQIHCIADGPTRCLRVAGARVATHAHAGRRQRGDRMLAVQLTAHRADRRGRLHVRRTADAHHHGIGVLLLLLWMMQAGGLLGGELLLLARMHEMRMLSHEAVEFALRGNHCNQI